MRVIAGTYRSRRLTAPPGIETRPTSDRLRETLFNVLAPRIEGAVFADLYAGSGAVGVEALSRGARMVCFADAAPAALAAVRKNLATLEIKSGFRIEAGKVSATLRRMASIEPFSVIFLDPPYAAIDEYARTLGSIGAGVDSLLTPDGIVVAEHSRQSQEVVSEQYGVLQRYRLLEQGDARLSFYRR
jgi:16S rRNA (guanine966-N2)-methyltransferase